jgi:lipoprotein-releasing system ATP-binding protein
MSEANAPFFEARGLRKTYLNGTARIEVLRGVGLSVFPGEMLSIVGPSGSGKSTLLHLLGALDRPDSGGVYLDGRDLFRLSENARARIRNESIGFVFQFYHLLPEFTALENVLMPALVYRARGAEGGGAPRARAAALLESVGLGDRLLHKPAQLSGGEQQRVAIARALMNRPRLVLADEPSGNLDSRTSAELHALLADMNRREGQAFVIVTHDDELSRRAHRRLRMRDGVMVPADE